MEKKYWSAPVPKTCDTCNTLITDGFFDARTIHGPWAIMCPTCFNLGPGLGRLGQGQGQEYSKRVSENGRFIKTGG